MGSYLVRRSLKIGGIDFTFSIEAHFWICFEEISRARATTTELLAQSIVNTHIDRHLPSAIRTYVLEYFRAQSLFHEDPLPSSAASTAMAGAWIGGTRPRWLN